MQQLLEVQDGFEGHVVSIKDLPKIDTALLLCSCNNLPSLPKTSGRNAYLDYTSNSGKKAYHVH